MTDKKVWFITGAGRGMGVDIAKAALAAGHAVVATGRNTDTRHRRARRARRPAGRQARRHRPRRRRGGRPGGRRPVRPHRRAGQQRRQLLRRVLRGDQPRGLPGADRDHPVRPDQRHPRRPAGHARPALRPRRHDLLDRRHRRPGVLHRLRRLQVRGRGLDGVADPRGRAVRHPHDARRARLLPHRAAHAGVHAATPSPRSTTTPSAPSRPSPPGRA